MPYEANGAEARSEKFEVVGGVFRARLSHPCRMIWRYRYPIAACLFLISPVLLFDVMLSVQNGRGIDKLSIFAVPASILWLAAAQSLFRRFWVAHLLLFPFYVLTAVDLFLIINYDVRITSSTISMMLENAHHLVDYGRAQTTLIALNSLLLIALFLALLFGMRDLEVRTWKPFMLSISGLLLIYTAVLAYRVVELKDVAVGAMDVVSHDRNSPFGVFPQSYIAYRIYEDAAEHQHRASSFSFEAVRSSELKKPEIYVLVIGESSRPDHWSLYGYGRRTTPRLEHIRNIVRFDNMVTQEALTQVSVPLMLTRRSIETPHAGLNEKSIMSAFREVGFATVWLSTQQRDQWTGAINRYAAEADYVRFYERRHDGVLVDAMKTLLEEVLPVNRRIFFVIHTQGSHFVFRDRYPAATAPFSTTGSSHDKLISEYDNSIEYTDRVLAAMIDVLSESGGTSGLLYVADHGENLNDDDRNLFGHMLNNEYDMPVPAFLWLSDLYATQEPEKVEAAKRNAARPLNTRVVFSTLADLAGIEIPDMDIGKLSILSTKQDPTSRIFIKHGRPLDFDEWMISSGLKRQTEANPNPRAHSSLESMQLPSSTVPATTGGWANSPQ